MGCDGPSYYRCGTCETYHFADEACSPTGLAAKAIRIAEKKSKGK